MQILNVRRQSGKSNYLLDHAYKNNYAIIVPTVSEKKKLQEIALDKKYLGVKIFTVSDFLHGINGAKFHRDDKVCIDNLDEVLKYLVGFDIDLATCTIPFDEEWLNEEEKTE